MFNELLKELDEMAAAEDRRCREYREKYWSPEVQKTGILYDESRAKFVDHFGEACLHNGMREAFIQARNLIEARLK